LNVTNHLPEEPQMARSQVSRIKTKISNSNGIKLAFFATLENVDKAAKEIGKFFTSVGIKRKTFNIILCVREALINAVTHGSGRDDKKNINFELKLEGNNIIIEVEDEGEGFDWRTCLSKGLPSKEESGRGLAIMKKCFAEIKYNEKGNRLTLKGNI
jgi:serine/threonine-protein kinase RsbW